MMTETSREILRREDELLSQWCPKCLERCVYTASCIHVQAARAVLRQELDRERILDVRED